MAKSVAEVLLRLKVDGVQSVEDLKRELKGVQDQLKANAAQGDDAGQKMVGFREGVDEAGDSASKLAQGLGVLSPSLQGAATVVADVADGMIGFIDAAKASGTSMAALGAAGVALGLVLGTLAAVYNAVSQEIERETALAEQQRQTHQDLVDVLREVEDANLRLAVATGDLSAAQAEVTGALTGARRSIIDYGESLRDQRAELRQNIDSVQTWLDLLQFLDGVTVLLRLSLLPLTAALGALAEVADFAGELVGIEAGGDALRKLQAALEGLDVKKGVAGLVGLTQSAAASQERLDALAEAEAARAKAAKEAAEVTATAAEVEDRKSEATQRGAERIAELTRLEDERTRLQERAQGVITASLGAEAQATARARAELEALRAEAARLGVTSETVAGAIAVLEDRVRALSFEEQLATAAVEFDAMFAPAERIRGVLDETYELLAELVPPQAKSDLEQLTEQAEKLADALAREEISPEAFEAANAALSQAAGQAQQGDRAGRVAGVIGTVAGGASAALSATASAGPVGMIIAAVISLVDALGKGLLDDLAGVVMSLLDTVGNLGPIIADFLSANLAPLITSVFENAALLVEGVLLDLVPVLLQLIADPQLYVAILKSLGLAVWEILKTLAAFVAGFLGSLKGLNAVVKSLVAQAFDILKDPATWAAVGDALGRLVTGVVERAREALIAAGLALVALVRQLATPGFWAALAQSIAEGVTDAFEGLMERIREFFGQDLLREIVAAFRGGFAAGREAGPQDRQRRDLGVAEFFQGAFERGESGAVGSFASGTRYVPRDGVAMVHRGEEIVPASRARGGGGSGGIVVNVNGWTGTPEAMVKALDRQIRRYNVKGLGNA